MSVGPLQGPVQRPGPDRDMGEAFTRIENLERLPPGRWIYVGTYPGDPDTTPDSPPFENSWVNAGGGARRLRFRRNQDWSLDIEGTVTGGVSGTTVTTLNELYRPSEDVEAPGVGGTWVLQADGQLVFTATEGADCCDTIEAELAAHIADPVGAHAATAISFAGSSVIPADNVQDAIEEVKQEILDHIADPEDAHMATAIGFDGSSDIPRDNVQEAIEYLESLIGGGLVTSFAKSGGTPLTGAVTISEGSGVTLTPSGNDIAIAATAAAGSSVLLYDYTVSGSDKASIDTGADTPQAGSAGTSAFSGAYRVLEVWIMARTDDAAAQAAFDMTVNNDTSSIYDFMVDSGTNATPAAGNSLAQAKWAINTHGSGGSASYPSVHRLSMPGYAATTFFKVAEENAGYTDATAGNNRAETKILGYRSTNAITRIKIAAQSTAKFKVGSRLLIYAR